MPGSPEPLIAVSLRCDAQAPRLARRAVDDALDWAPVRDDARLVASELVNQAVSRLGYQADAIIRVMVRVEGGFVVISVHDPGDELSSGVAPGHEDRDAAPLRQAVVQQLAHRWGTEHPDGRCVWAALPVGTSGPAPLRV